jgi:hypothetical protein
MAKGKRNTKKTNLKKIESVGGFDGDIKGKIITVICILLFFGAFYLLTLYITNKNSDKKDDNEEKVVNISYDTIMLGRSLSMSDGEYLVIYYDKSNEDINSTYSSLVSTYKTKDEHLTIYTVDMSNGFNKKYVTDGESNKNPESVDAMSINGPTLIKVNENKVVEYIEGQDAISSYLG